MYDQHVLLFIDGQWVAGSEGETIPIENPALGTVIGTVSAASAADLDRALAAADRAFNVWKATAAMERWTLLSKAADLMEERCVQIGRVLTMENGKLLSEATGEIQFCADATRWYAEEAKRAYGRIIPARSRGVRQLVTKEPVGPALGFAAWNFPAGNVALKIAAALAAGCSIIVKPSNETPASAAAIARCFQEAGAPAGLLNVVYGPSAPLSEHLISSPIPKKLSLTGSTPVGKQLQRLAADSLKRCTMELGGHAPVIVHADADLEATLDTLVKAKFRNAGQVCTSPTRFYVHKSIYEDFVDGFVARVEKINVGNGLEPGVDMGPMTIGRRLESMDNFVQDAVQRGGKLLTGGHRLSRPGFFYAPTVIRDVPDDALIMMEEPFGPIAPITPFENFDEVIGRANSLTLGLASYVFTRSAALASATAGALDAGQVGINHTAVHEAETPFGGVNESGYGSESGIEGLDAYHRIKHITELHRMG